MNQAESLTPKNNKLDGISSVMTKLNRYEKY